MGHMLEGMQFISIFIKNKVFIYIFLIMTWLGLIWSIIKLCCLNQKGEAQLKIEEMRRKLFKKEDRNKEINIEMTEMNLNAKEEKTYRTP